MRQKAHCRNPAIVREHFIRKGPHGHLTWLQANLSTYTFQGREAAEIRTSIQEKGLANQEHLAQLEERFLLLEGERIGFLKLFQRNLFAGASWLSCGTHHFQ